MLCEVGWVFFDVDDDDGGGGGGVISLAHIIVWCVCVYTQYLLCVMQRTLVTWNG